MTDRTSRLIGETLITLKEAADDFGGVKVPMTTLLRWIKTGIQGLRLEVIDINKLYTSKEAIQRFLERKQCLGQIAEQPKTTCRGMSGAEIAAELRRLGVVK